MPSFILNVNNGFARHNISQNTPKARAQREREREKDEKREKYRKTDRAGESNDKVA